MASSNYQGGQYGGRARAGFSIPVYTVELAPLGYVQYAHLNRSRYQEKGAPGFNLAVESHQVVGTQFGMGFRVTEVSQSEEFLPELHVMFINDVRSPDLIVTSQFVDGGSAFVSQGPKPPKAGVNIGMSVTALMQEDFLLVGGYDYETKKGFNSHSASVKFKWLFF
jgi:outer membrane autotransporter protein